MAEAITIPINIRLGDISGLQAIQRAIERMSQHVEGGGFEPSYRTISQRLRSAISRSGDETSAAIQGVVRNIRAAVQGTQVPLGATLAAINQQLQSYLGVGMYQPIPGGGSQRVGYTGSAQGSGYINYLQPFMPPGPAGRPNPALLANLPASPFGPGAGGPPGVPPPARQSTIQRLGLVPRTQGTAFLQSLGAAYAPIYYPPSAAQQAQNAAQAASLMGNYGMGPSSLASIGAAYAPIHYHATAAQQAQNAAQVANLMGNYGMGRPPMPPPSGPYTPWGPGMVGGPGGHLTAAWLGSGWSNSGGLGGGIESGVGALAPILARGMGWAGRLGAAGVGYSAYKLLSEGMQAYETRAMGVIRLGGQMNQEYGELDTTIKSLRSEFQMLAKDSVDMMGVLARTTGRADRGVAANLARFALVHGMPGAEVAAHYGTMALYGADRNPNMAVIEAIRREGVAGGGMTLPTAPFQAAVAQMGMVGGTSLLPMGGIETARYATMMGLFGQKYGAAPAQAFAQFAGGLSGPKSMTGELVVGMALDRLRRKNPLLTIGDPERGGMRLNLNNYHDWLIAKEQAGMSPEIQDAILQESTFLGGGNAQMEEWYLGHGLGETSLTRTRQTGQGLREARRQGGGTLAGYVRRGASPVAADATEQARVEVLQSNKELWDTLRLAVQGEVMSENGLIAQLRHLRLEMEETANSIAKTRGPVDAVVAAWQGLSSETQVLIGLGLMGAGMFTGNPLLVGGGTAVVGSGSVKALTQQAAEEDRKRQQQTGPRKTVP